MNRRPTRLLRNRRQPRRYRESRGAVIIEAAIVLPVLLALLGGFIDFAWVLNDLQTTRQEVREVARDAAVADTGNTTGCAHGAGSVNATTESLICSIKSRAGAEAVVKVTFPDIDGYEVGSAIRVCVERPYVSLSGMYASLIEDGAAKVRVESRIEQTAAAPIQAFEEPAPSGLDWGFCA